MQEKSNETKDIKSLAEFNRSIRFLIHNRSGLLAPTPGDLECGCVTCRDTGTLWYEDEDGESMRVPCVCNQ